MGNAIFQGLYKHSHLMTPFPSLLDLAGGLQRSGSHLSNSLNCAQKAWCPLFCDWCCLFNTDINTAVPFIDIVINVICIAYDYYKLGPALWRSCQGKLWKLLK